MPHIKKPFAKQGVTCYKCGKAIEDGSVNWSYNTHSRGAFAHQDCNVLVPSKHPMNTPTQPPVPKVTSPTIRCASCELSRTIVYTIYTSTKVCNCTWKDDTLQSDPSPASTASPIKLSFDITDKISIKDKHFSTKWIQTILRHRKYPFLHGSPGAGKTHLIMSLASDMGLPFLLVTCAQDMLKSELLGVKSPLSGAYSASKFRSLWQHGGLVLFDECGLAPGAFLNILNAAMEQRIIDFPDGEQIAMHPNFFMCFADNSTLYGTDNLFPERQDVGGAFRDRLTYVEFEYDLDIERRVIISKFNGDVASAVSWHKKVLCLREELKKLEVAIFASPRFAYASATWLLAGVDLKTIIKAELLRGVSIDLVKTVAPTIQKCLGVSL